MFFATPNTYIVFLIMGQTFWADFLPPSGVLALLAHARLKCLEAFVIFGTEEQIKHVYQFINTLSRSLYFMGEETLILLIVGSDCGH